FPGRHRWYLTNSEPRAALALYGAVHHVHRPFSREHAAHFTGCSRLESHHGFLAVPRGVRIDDDVLAAAQRVWIGQRLRIRGIERRSGDLSRVERAHQRLRINDGTARAVDQKRRRLHQRESLVADHFPGLRHERRVHRYEVGLLEHLVQLHLRAGLAELPRLDVRIRVQDPHAESGGTHCNLPGDIAEAHQAERGPRQAEHRLAGRNFPAAAANETVVEGDFAGAGEEQSHGVLGDLLDAIGRVGGHDDAGPGGGLEVYGIDANPVAGDDLAPRHLRHDLRRDGTGVRI